MLNDGPFVAPAGTDNRGSDRVAERRGCAAGRSAPRPMAVKGNSSYADTGAVRLGGVAPALKPVADTGAVRLGGVAPAPKPVADTGAVG